MEGIKDNHNLTYKSSISSQELWSYVKAIGIPSLVFIESMFVILQFGNFGRILLSPMYCLMWAAGILAAFVLPSHRSSIIRETITTVGIYGITLYTLRIIIFFLSGISAATLASSFSVAIPETSGNAAMGWIQGLLYIGSIGTPLGFLGAQGQKIFKLKRNANKMKTFNQLRGIRDTNKDIQ